MRRMSVSELTTYSWSLDEDVYHYSRLGYSAIGIWRAKLEDFGPQRGIQLIQDAGLSVSSLSWIGGFTGSDGIPHDDSVVDGLRTIRLAHELRAACVITHPGGQGGHTAKHARRLFCLALERLLPLAEELNVTLGIEPMHPACAGDCTFLTSLDPAVELIRQMGSPNLKLVWDTYQLWHEGQSLARIASLVDHIGLVQLSDARQPPSFEQDRCRLGAGAGPWHRMLRHLRMAGYAGPWELEIMGDDVASAGYLQVLEDCFTAVTGRAVASSR
ncbi:MAG: sugar phosphate isomerase/epimerase family protein [Pirellulales bacterium]